jgi:hypothetical protein
MLLLDTTQTRDVLIDILKYRDTTLQFASPRTEVAAAMQGTYAIHLKSVCTDDQHKQRAHLPPSVFMRPGVKQTTFFRYDALHILLFLLHLSSFRVELMQTAGHRGTTSCLKIMLPPSTYSVRSHDVRHRTNGSVEVLGYIVWQTSCWWTHSISGNVFFGSKRYSTT